MTEEGKKKRVYISGQITGLDEREYKAFFKQAEGILRQFGYDPKRYKRFSGKWYRNSPEKLQAIKEKYRNGVSKGLIENWLEIKQR